MKRTTAANRLFDKLTYKNFAFRAEFCIEHRIFTRFGFGPGLKGTGLGLETTVLDYIPAA
jgi:hypothetical protein